MSARRGCCVGQSVIRVRFLEKAVADILLIGEHPANSCGRPASVSLGRNASPVQVVRNGVGTFAGEQRCEDFLYHSRLLRIYDHLLAIPIVAVGWVADFIGAAFKAFLD